MNLVETMYGIIKYMLIARLAGRNLRKLAEGLDSPEDIVDLAFSFKYRDPIASAVLGCDVYIDIRPAQVYEEILGLAKLIDELKPRAIVEIGTAGGGTLFLWCRLAAEDATIISVDLPRGMFGGGYPKWKVPIYRSFAKEGQKIYLIRGDSHDPTTLERVKSILADRKIDFLFIDGDHTYEGVRRDFEIYGPLVRSGGIIAFHDIVTDFYTRYGIRTDSQTGGVPIFWTEVKQRFRYLELVKDREQDGCGIGVLFKS